ncbi:MAG TPA: hypothetical protein DCP92_15330 [Nitrospiraceae bacterium]|jgi:hypothetical protein|nr:hypothetical protein [Nitrospiraceae bacterium]
MGHFIHNIFGAIAQSPKSDVEFSKLLGEQAIPQPRSRMEMPSTPLKMPTDKKRDDHWKHLTAVDNMDVGLFKIVFVANHKSLPCLTLFH